MMVVNQTGQSLLEVTIMLGMVVVIITAVTITTVVGIKNSQFSKNQLQATKLAQEGIERVRIGRDRNQSIVNLPNVTSWNGDITGVGSFWDYSIRDNCQIGGTCYFKITDVNGGLEYKTSSLNFPASVSVYEDIYSDGKFKRVVILSDDDSYKTQKKVTVIVTWTDFSGNHESKLTTILRKI